MKTFTKKILYFSLFSAIIYVVIIIIGGTLLPKTVNVYYKRGGYGHLYTRLKEVKETKDIDILFLGNSHTYRAFDPRIFKEYGFKTFNLGSSAQTPLQTQILIERYINSLNPKLIIYEVSPMILLSDGLESAIDLISNDKNDFRSVNLAFKISNPKLYNTLIFSTYKNLLSEEYEEPVEKGDDRYIKGGFVEKDLKFYKVGEVESTIEKDRRHENKKQISAFTKNIKFFKKNKYDYILVQTPITTQAYNSLDSVQFDKKMDLFGEYYNFNLSNEFIDTLHFYDEHHLNKLGAKLYDSIIINRLDLKRRIK